MAQKGLQANVEINIKDILERTKEFGKEFEELCYKYGLAPDIAKDDKTKNIYFVVNVKDLINKNDIKIQIKK